MFTFTTKQEYLTYRSEWKKKYNELSQSIRDMKFVRKIHAQIFSKAEKIINEQGAKSNYYRELWDIQEGLLKELRETHERYSLIFNKYKDKNGIIRWYSLIDEYRKSATQMLEELKLAKIEANRQYLASKSIETTNK